MGRMGSLMVVLFCSVAAIARVSADPWWPGWGDWDKKSPPPPLYPAPVTPAPPSPYYDTPPYLWPPPPVVASSPPYGLPSDPPPYVVPKNPPPYVVPAPPLQPVYPSPPISSPEEPPYPWFSSSLAAETTENWPAKFAPESTVEETFGKEAEVVYGQVSLFDGILSKGEDGYSKLLKEAIAALLNSIDKHFKYTEDEVKKCFTAALSSEDAAKVQAQKFENANSGYGLFN